LKKHGNESSLIDFEEGGPSTGGRAVRPRVSRPRSKDLKRDASSLAQETLKGLIIEKKEANASRNEMRGRQIDEHMEAFLSYQKKS
jgi:hypothetical protein